MFSIVATLLVAALSALPGGQAAPFDLVARQMHQGEGKLIIDMDALFMIT
jgi:hypothetical protein